MYLSDLDLQLSHLSNLEYDQIQSHYANDEVGEAIQVLFLQYDYQIKNDVALDQILLTLHPMTALKL